MKDPRISINFRSKFEAYTRISGFWESKPLILRYGRDGRDTISFCLQPWGECRGTSFCTRTLPVFVCHCSSVEISNFSQHLQYFIPIFSGIFYKNYRILLLLPSFGGFLVSELTVDHGTLQDPWAAWPAAWTAQYRPCQPCPPCPPCLPCLWCRKVQAALRPQWSDAKIILGTVAPKKMERKFRRN